MDLQALAPLLFLPVFAGFWTAVCCLLSLVGGWHQLARQYPATAEAPGEEFRMASGAVGDSPLPVSYRSCLMVSVGEGGIRLGVFFLFRPLHPAMFIPWSAVESVEQKRFLFRMQSAIAVRGFGRCVFLYGGAGHAVSEAFARMSAARA